MLDIQQFKSGVIIPALDALAAWNANMSSAAAIELLLGTALQESRLTYLRQLSGGPGLGVFQIETATHDDVWTNYLDYRPELADIVKGFAAGGERTAEQLTWNMGYGAMIARLVYWRAPAPMPAADDINALGKYWKTHYNTAGGAGTAQQWQANYREYVPDAA